MKLTEQQVEMIRRLMHGPEGMELVRILELYVDEIKDDCVAKKVSQDGAAEAIAKLREIVAKIKGQPAGGRGSAPDFT